MPTLRDLRRVRALTQLELAQQLGVQVKSVVNWETGKRAMNMISRKKYLKLWDIDPVKFDKIIQETQQAGKKKGNEKPF